ncbi:MAG: hypothetical protein ACYC42_02645 [Lysobacter sp.]
MVPTTRFTDRAAVDAWDSRFRWRNGDGLRDRTIDATWWRVADAIAGMEGEQNRLWAYRYVDAFSRWQLLPDERLLRMAGTGPGLRPFEAPSGTLNVAGFVTAPLTQQARFDSERFADVAALAVRLLDDALVTMHGAAPMFSGLRIGLIGLADALHLLGIPYDDPRAAEQACVVGAALATGALQGTTELARERGPIDARPAHLVALWRDRGTPDVLVEAAMQGGVRHARLTAIGLQPHVALLANNASDALDPSPPRPRPARDEPLPYTADASPAIADDAMVSAQLAIRAAIQPWIDAPIDYPVTMAGEPDAARIASFTRLAGAYGLCEPSFRCSRQ